MIKQGITNYFKSLKYFFTPLGTLALGLILGVSIAVPSIISSLKSMVNSVIEISNSAELDFMPFLNSLWDSTLALNWSEPISAFHTLISDEWLNTTLQTSLQTFVGNYEPLAVELGETVQLCVSQITHCAVVVLLFTAMGVVGGYFLTKYLIRRNIARRAWWKWFLVTLVDSLLTAGTAYLGVWLTELWSAGFVIALIVPPLLFGTILLLEAYLVHGVKRVDLKEIITIKNIAQLVLTNFIIFYISIAFGSIVAAIFNKIAGLVIGLAFLEIGFIVIGMNAEAYVKSLVPAAPEKPEPETTNP
ncbi:MAG: hypothetical protein K2K12_01335 [Clostridia bacterium]|nr:hypothetical protein [Clostridia bacterium]